MKKIVVYKSKSGFTKKYAEWIAKELQCDISSIREAKSGKLQDYDVIIYGGGIMAGSISGFKSMKKWMNTQNEKKLIAFCTGCTPETEKNNIEQITKRNFSDEERRNIPFFYFPSGLNYEKMSGMRRIIMKMMRNALGKKKDKSEAEVVMLKSIQVSSDNSDPKYIEPLISYVREMDGE